MSYGKLTSLLMSILIAVVGLCMNLMADTDYGEEILEKRTESSRTYYKDGIYTCVSMSNHSIDKNKTNQLSSMTTDYIDPLVAITLKKKQDNTVDTFDVDMIVGSYKFPNDSINLRVFIRYPLYSIDDTMCIYNVDDYHLTSNYVWIYPPSSAVNVYLRNCSPVLMNIPDYLYNTIWDGIPNSPILTSGEFGSGSAGQSLDVDVEDYVKSIHNNNNNFFLLGL
ncbi:MAG: hypothetical protein KBA26_06395, partial [Candidatus Delongbacteria bacterium]|nr:hypothetical protein [Candidatus Delongbacteria bacterium]